MAKSKEKNEAKKADAPEAQVAEPGPPPRLLEYYKNTVCPKLAKEFEVQGVVWYQLMYRDSYDIESSYFPEVLKRETGLSMLKIASDYDAAETGPFRTRVEAFVEALRR